MPTINELKEQTQTETPLLLFDCELSSGAVERWSTHAVDVNGQHYDARVLKHNLYEMQSGADQGIDAIATISITLANADSHCSEIERNTGWKGSVVTVRFVFFDLIQGAPASEIVVLFSGMADAPNQITESTLRLTVTNSLNLQRMQLPDVRVQRRCPWNFPGNAAQCAEAVSGGTEGRYDPFYRCGYSADQSGGCGNLNAGAPYTTCDGTRAACQARGMFSGDAGGNITRRFGGIEFIPPTTVVRSYGEKGRHVSQALDNEARYNDFVPLVYGTAWYSPLIVFSKNDGNLTHMDVLLGTGEIQQVLTVLVNDIEIPLGQAGTNMTATGWFNVITPGARTGVFNPEYHDAAGNPLGDPYGSMAVLSVVVPNRINDGSSLPQIQVLLEGRKLEQYSTDGTLAAYSFTNNPAWVVLDVLRRCGWELEDLDLASFANAAQYCAELIPAVDLYGNPVSIPRFQCNLVLEQRRSAADVMRGIRNGARLFLTYSTGGLLQLNVENTIALQQPTKAAGSNSTSMLEGGWPAYEFGDGSMGFSGILRKANGEPSISLSSKSTAETPNRMTVEFQDAFNEYQQDSLSLVNLDDVLLAGQEVSLTLQALGIPNFDQAARIITFQLDKADSGNTYATFETSVKAIGLKPGDLITITYLKEGLERQPFRVIKIAPSINYQTAQITAQIHDDAWYSDTVQLGSSNAGRQQQSAVGMPRPLTGKILNANGQQQFDISESSVVGSDGSANITLTVGFVAPPRPALASVGIPIVSLSAEIDNAAGSLAGGETLYYATSALDALGEESALSFVVRAAIPVGTNTNAVTLTGLSFSQNTTGFNVYRGAAPTQLLQIAANQAVGSSFIDTGMKAQLVPPPDENYDHANFYWRLEILPECAATSFSSSTIGNSSLATEPNAYRGMTVRITRGTGAGQERAISSHTATVFTVAPNWDLAPDATSYFVIAEAGWHFGVAAASSPAAFEVPNRIGVTVDVSGRAANVYNLECGPEESPLTRWCVGGSGDADVPGQPVFGVLPRCGALELATIAFSDLANTRTISSATLIVNYWDELASPSPITLGGALASTDTLISLSEAGSAQPGDLVQIGSEILSVVQVNNGGTQYQVKRGAEGSTASSWLAQTPVYHLDQKVFIVPFSRDFFGSPASGNFSYSLPLPDARVASVDLFMTNVKGNSATAVNCYTGTVDGGLRTLSGGQFSIQVEGYLAIETNAAPALIVQDSHSVRDVFAFVREAPDGAPVQLTVRQGSTVYCNLTVPVGENYSNVVNGFGLPPLLAESEIDLDIVSAASNAEGTPGRDLTVTIRM